jgi:hypothetical protein
MVDLGICQRECTTYFSFLRDQVLSVEEQLHTFLEKEIFGKLPLESCTFAIVFINGLI